MHPKIAIVEKDRLKREYLRKRIGENGYIPICFSNEGTCLENLESVRPEAILIEPRSMEMFSVLLKAVEMISEDLPVLIIAPSHEIKQYMNSINLSSVEIVDARLERKSFYKTLKDIKAKKTENIGKGPEIIGESYAIRNIKKRIPVIGQLPEPVMIIGENGVGKELIARSINYASRHLYKKTIKIDASRITREDLEKNLFHVNKNHENSGKKFIFEGDRTILIDKLDQLDRDVQAEMLHIVECQKNNKLRIISAVSENLEEKVKSGIFRKDLYYRLGVLKLYVPPLRKRVEDISALSDFFALKFSLGQKKSYYKLPRATKDSFEQYKWPGNVTELYNIVRRIVVNGEEPAAKKHFALSKTLTKENLINHEKTIGEIYNLKQVKKYLQGSNPIHLKKISDEISVRTEKKIISYALNRTKWNRKNAAEFLCISYKALLNKIKLYALD